MVARVLTFMYISIEHVKIKYKYARELADLEELFPFLLEDFFSFVQQGQTFQHPIKLTWLPRKL